MAVTTFERGVQQGELKGRQEGYELGLRRAIDVQLRTRFAAIPDAALARLERMKEPELVELLEQLTGATSLAELGLAEET